MATLTRLVMTGPAPAARGGLASVIAAYRAHGLFERWPIDYVAADLKAPARVAALLAQHRRIVLHVHTAARPGFWRAAWCAGAALAARCPVILHLHGGGFERFYDASNLAAQALMRFLLEHAACVAVPSQLLAGWVHSVSPAVRATLLPNPVELPVLQATPRPNLVLFLGSLHREKGIFDLLEALSQLRAAVPDVRLVCAGEGERGPVMRYAERLGIADAVKFTGWVGPSGRRVLLESAAVYAQPSYADGMPMSLLEAMAAAVPVVASTAGGTAEVLVDGTSGLLVAPGDCATLQRLLRKLLLDRKLAARIGAAGRETVRARFSAEHAVPRLEAIYAGIGLSQTGIHSSPWPASQAG
jgi:glycosyltransferase involved in cell wall biosynthesis